MDTEVYMCRLCERLSEQQALEENVKVWVLYLGSELA